MPSDAFYSTATPTGRRNASGWQLSDLRSLTQWAARMILTLPALPEEAREELVRLRVKVFYHDKCFDGACSASLFTRFHRECIAKDAAYDYHGLVHRAGALFDESDFTGDENAIVDFKYSASPQITWWFDHHESAFLTPGDAEHFEQDQSNRKFYDPSFRSCTKFLATVAEQRFGFNPAPVSEVIEW